LVLWDLTKSPVQSRIVPLPKGETPQPSDNCGIHSIALSPSRSLLATGGENPAEVAIFDVASMSPIFILEGHKDWSFSTAFLNDDRLISGSRDCTVNLWTTQDSGSVYEEEEDESDEEFAMEDHCQHVGSMILPLSYSSKKISRSVKRKTPILSKKEHDRKVRNVKYNSSTEVIIDHESVGKKLRKQEKGDYCVLLSLLNSN